MRHFKPCLIYWVSLRNEDKVKKYLPSSRVYNETVDNIHDVLDCVTEKYVSNFSISQKCFTLYLNFAHKT